MRLSENILIGTALGMGFLLTAWGFYQSSVPLDVPVMHWAFMLCTLPLIELVKKKFSLGIIGAAGILAVLLLLLTSNLWPMLVIVWFSMAATLLGRTILSALQEEDLSQGHVESFLVGACLYGTAAGVLAHFPINYPGLYATALATPIILNWRSAGGLTKEFVRALATPKTSNWQETLIAAIMLLYIATALMPEVGHDALAMHLFVPVHLATRHEWGFDVNTYVWAVMPMLGDWIFAFGYMLGGETAARLINVMFIFLLARLIHELVIWAGGTVPGSRIAILIFLSTPLTFTEGSSLFIESVWASYIVAGAFATMRLITSSDERGYKWGSPGILLGGALAAKAITFSTLPVLLLVIVGSYQRWFKAGSVAALGIGLCLFLAIGMVPYVTAWSLTGNPVFPFFNQLFQSQYFPPTNFDSSSIFSGGLSWDILYQVTFSSGSYLEAKVGASGFQWLLLLVPAFLGLLILRNRRGLALFFFMIGAVVLTFLSVAYLRYVFPSVVVTAACIGISWSYFMTANSSLRRLAYLMGFLAILLNMLFFTAGTYYGQVKAEALKSPMDRHDYLQIRLPIRNAVEIVNLLNKGQLPVAVFAPPLTAGLNADALYPNWYNAKFLTSINMSTTADDIASVLIRNGVEYLILDKAWGSADKQYLVEQATVEIAKIGAISIKRLDTKYRYKTELLVNSDFKTDEGWIWQANDINREADGVLASVDRPAYQIVPVRPKRQYENRVVARCAEQNAQGRLQVNWLNEKYEYINTEIQVFDCSASVTEYTVDVVSPLNAAYAAVYATGHTSIALVFSKVSFRQ